MSNPDPYSDPDTGVLYNKLGLHTWEELQDAEREITRRRVMELAADPPRPTYDLDHLRTIHRRLFSDLYTWAGEIRTVDIAKTDLFCRPQFIVEQSQQLFSELANDNHLNGLDRQQFINKVAHYLGELNAIHPFREGNGRTQRAFVAQLASDAGYLIDWQNFDERKNIEASKASFKGNIEPLRQLLNIHVISTRTKKPPTKPSPGLQFGMNPLDFQSPSQDLGFDRQI